CTREGRHHSRGTAARDRCGDSAGRRSHCPPLGSHTGRPRKHPPSTRYKKTLPSSIVRARASQTKALHNKSNAIVGDSDGYRLKPDAIFPPPFHWCVGLDCLPSVDTVKADRAANVWRERPSGGRTTLWPMLTGHGSGFSISL